MRRCPCSTANTLRGAQTKLIWEPCQAPCTTALVQGHNMRMQGYAVAPKGHLSSRLRLRWGEAARLPCSLGAQRLCDAVPWCVRWRRAMSFMQIPCRNQTEKSHALSELRGLPCLYWDFVPMHQLQDLVWKIITWAYPQRVNEISEDCIRTWISDIFW